MLTATDSACKGAGKFILDVDGIKGLGCSVWLSPRTLLVAKTSRQLVRCHARRQAQTDRSSVGTK